MGILTYGTFKMKAFADAKEIAFGAKTFKEGAMGALNLSTAYKALVHLFTPTVNSFTKMGENAKAANINLQTLKSWSY